MLHLLGAKDLVLLALLCELYIKCNLSCCVPCDLPSCSVQAAPEAEANAEKEKPDLPETSREPSQSADSSAGCVDDSGGARGEGAAFGEERPRKRRRGRPRKIPPPEDSDGKLVTSESSCSSNRGWVTTVCPTVSDAVESVGGCTADVEVCAGKPSLASGGDEKGREEGIVCGWMTLACPSWPRFLAVENINPDPDMDGTLAVPCGSSRRAGRLTVAPSRKRKLMSGSASTTGVRGRGVKRKSTGLCVEPATKVRRRQEGVKGVGNVKGETKEEGSWASGWLSPMRKF